MRYPCICGMNHRIKKYADWHTQKILDRIKHRSKD